VSVPGAHCCPRCALEDEWARLAHLPLLSCGGVGLYEGLFDAASSRALLAEATHLPQRADCAPPGHDTEQVRGGEPARLVRCVDGGPAQTALFNAPALHKFITQQIGARVRPCGGRATYSIYADEGAHLDIHRDIPGCDVALIACLQDSEPDDAGGAIEIWLDHPVTPLDEVRSGAAGHGTRFTIAPGQTMLLHGGVLPHRIPPIRAGRMRVVSLMCFELAG
jgi:hypothetical protein